MTTYCAKIFGRRGYVIRFDKHQPVFVKRMIMQQQVNDDDDVGGTAA